MLNLFGFMKRAHTRMQEANWVQTKFLASWGTLLFVAILISALGSAIGQDNWSHFFEAFCKVFGIGIVVASASAMVAWLFGLLFGIPKSNAGGGGQHSDGQTPVTPPASASQPAAREQTSRPNTNLEDVSDWLTKTLIGVGLTQLTALPHKLWQYATILDQASLKGQGGGAVFILGLALAGGAGGFWVGYVTTRTLLTALFGLFDEPSAGDVEIAADPNNLKLGADQKPVASTNPAVQAADQKLRRLSLDQLSTPTAFAAWGAAQARALNLGNALQAVSRAAAAAPEDENIRELQTKIEQANRAGGG